MKFSDKERTILKNIAHRHGNRARDAVQYIFAESFRNKFEGVAVRVWRPMHLSKILQSVSGSLLVTNAGKNLQDLEVGHGGVALPI